MKDKQVTQREYNLVMKLLGEVNSKTEFDYLLGEKTRLWGLLSPFFPSLIIYSLSSQSGLVGNQLNKIKEI